jgi:AMP nucleosidase
MTASHSDRLGVSIIDFSIGSPVAALIIEVLATAEPKATLFLGICGGLHRSLEVGDFVLPTAAIRDEGSSKHFMPPQVPALPTFKIQKFVSQIVVERGLDYRTGVVHTTDYRFWEFDERFKAQLYEERAWRSTWRPRPSSRSASPARCRSARSSSSPTSRCARGA